MIPHFMHRAIHHCQGYQKFLDNLQFGKYFQFNAQYFFFSVFWLVRHKLYSTYYFLIICSTYLMYLATDISGGNIEETTTLYLNFIFLLHLFMSFFTHKIYYVTLDEKFSKVNYDYDKSLKIATPYPWYINFGINILIPLSAFVGISVLYAIVR